MRAFSRSAFLSLALFAAVLLGAAPAAQAQSAPSGDGLGYVDPSVFEGWFDELPAVEVNLRGTLLRMVSAGIEASPENDDRRRAAAILKRVDGIYVRVYESNDVPRGTLEARSSDLIERLRTEGWETIVRVREDDEQVNIQLRSRDDDTVAGLVVLVNEVDGESVFVNIVGDISPEDVGQLVGSVDGLDGLGLGRLGRSGGGEDTP